VLVSDKNKGAVFAEALRAGDAPCGTVRFSRWGEAVLPERRSGTAAHLTDRAGFFVYGKKMPHGTGQWHMNYAMGDCFGAYAGPLLAQDEL
jgi:hypothetical protein